MKQDMLGRALHEHSRREVAREKDVLREYVWSAAPPTIAFIVLIVALFSLLG